MKKKIMIPLLLSAALLAGCQAKPEESSDTEMLRAKGRSEDVVESIVYEEALEDGEEGTEGQMVDLVLGSGENRMWIKAEIPVAPKALSILTMQMDSGLDEGALQRFLEPQGEVEDITQKKLEELEEERQRQHEADQALGEGDSIVELATIGDGSYQVITDGNRTASLSGKTTASYEDTALKEKCLRAAQVDAEGLDVKSSGADSFFLQSAKEILLDKLSDVGIEDISFVSGYFYEKDGFAFYEVQFVPVVEGISMASSFGQTNMVHRVYPEGIAWVSAEGVADLGIWNFCMEKVSASEENQILGWEKLQKLLGTYLDDGSLQCRESVPFSTVELVYYPVFKESRLELVPMWCIHMDLGEYVEYTGQSGINDSLYNIYINAVTGEIEEVQ